jgi:hypothetical protein
MHHWKVISLVAIAFSAGLLIQGAMTRGPVGLAWAGDIPRPYRCAVIKVPSGSTIVRAYQPGSTVTVNGKLYRIPEDADTTFTMDIGQSAEFPRGWVPVGGAGESKVVACTTLPGSNRVPLDQVD